MGSKIFREGLSKKAIATVMLLVAAGGCYAFGGIDFAPLMGVITAQTSRVVAQATTAAGNNVAKLGQIEGLNRSNLAKSEEIAGLTRTLGQTLGLPTELPNGDNFSRLITNWMQDFITDPKLMLGVASALKVPSSTTRFDASNYPNDLNVNFANTHKTIEDQLVASADTPAEYRRIAALREYMVEDATVTGVSLATVNKQTTTKTRNWIKRISDSSVKDKNLRDDIKTTNDYLMVVASELISIRELQAQQLELLSAFTRTFVEPGSHLEEKKKFRQQRGGR